MGSTYRERDRFDDSRTSISTARRGGDNSYTTVKRYIVKDDDTRSSYGRDDRRFSERPERVEETRIVRREREIEEPPRRREDPRYSEQELVIRRDRTPEPPRRDYDYGRRRDDETTNRELVIRRTTEVDEPRRDYRDSRYDRDYEVMAQTRRDFPDRDLERYTRTAEYFGPPMQPQTIIIKQEPIIIRERVRDDDYQIVRRSDIEDDRSVSRRDDRGGGGGGREEEYFYEKKVKERVDEPRRDERDDDFYERRSTRREVSPGDSVSQAGGRGRARSRGDYSSDDSMVYVRKETKTTDNDYDRDRSGSPKHRRHLAEGVIAGIGAAELLRSHKRKEGREVSGGIGRAGRDLGAGALGALAAEGISRARSLHRSRSRRRERSGSGDNRKGRKGRSQSGSGSEDRLKTIGKYGLGAAALAAAAAFAQNRMSKNKENNSRSRSRHRRGSRSRSRSRSRSSSRSDARNPGHRNKRMAEAGAAGAVVAGLIERARSKSRTRKGERSPSRVRQALPIVAAGLGSAALAGVYERNKAKKEEDVVRKEKRRNRSRQRSRSMPRDQPQYYDGPPAGAVSDQNLVTYGQGDIRGANFGPEYYGRAPPQEGFYDDQTAVVPAAAAAGGYGAQRELRSRSTSRRRSSSRSSDSDASRSHRRRRKHDKEKAAAAGVGGAVAASEFERRRAEKKERKARRRAEEEQYAYENTYNHPPQGYTPPPPVNDPYATQSGFYPQAGFPPPPGSGPQQYPNAVPPTNASGVFAPGQAYDPAHFPPPPPAPAPGTAAPYNPAFVAGGNQDPYAPRARGGDENVSAALDAFGNPFSNSSHQHQSVPDAGLNGIPRASPAPAINVQPPAMSSAAYQPPDPTVYTPPSDGSSRSKSVPPPSAGRKSVQFAESPLVAAVLPTTSSSNAPAELEQSRHPHRHKNRATRGYEASDDTDSPDDVRHRSEPQTDSITDHRHKPQHKGHNLRPSHEPQVSNISSSNEPVSDPRLKARDRQTGAASPALSDETIDLPPRFDKNGKKRMEPGEDVVADKLDEILAGRGGMGKMFGNFVDGLFGPEGRKKGKS